MAWEFVFSRVARSLNHQLELSHPAGSAIFSGGRVSEPTFDSGHNLPDACTLGGALRIARVLKYRSCRSLICTGTFFIARVFGNTLKAVIVFCVNLSVEI